MQTDCVLTSCVLGAAGCLTSWSSPDIILGTSPYPLSALETNPVGYSHSFCLKCGITPNGLTPIFFDFDGIVITAL